METADIAAALDVAIATASDPGKPAVLMIMEPEDWRTQCAAHVFRSMESMRYFIRQHRDELIDCGAIVAPIGRQMINPPLFEAAVMNIGQRLARSLRRCS